MTIKEIISSIFSSSQNFSLFCELYDSNKLDKQKRLKCLIKDDCIFHKHWYEPVNYDNNEPKHIQIDRCKFGLLTKGNCNTECRSYIPLDSKKTEFDYVSLDYPV